LGFDGGRFDPYHITERRRKFQGSLWLGNRGLKWALEEMGKLKDSPSAQAGSFKFLRDGYRTLELSCLSNHGGRFVELVEYHGGSQRGNLRIPEGHHGVGWATFLTELRGYFLTKIEPSAPSDGKARRSAQGSRNRDRRKGRQSNANFPCESRYFRDLDKFEYLAPNTRLRESRQQLNETKVNSRVMLSDLEPRPTRKFDFKWILGQKSLRVNKLIEGPRVVSWVRPRNETHESIPQSSNPIELEPQSTGPLGVDLIVEEQELHRKPTEVSGEVEAEINPTGQVEDPIETNPPVVVLTEEEEEDGSVYSENENDLCGSPPVMVTMTPSESSSRSLVRRDLAENIHHEDLDGALVLGSSLEIADPHAPMGMEFDTDPATRVLELTEFDAEPQSPMVCKPLAIIEPSVQKVMLSGNSGEKMRRGGKRSKWVNDQYKEICKLMGFPIDNHEQECLDLLRRIDATRDSKKGELGLRKVTASKLKGVRELKNLAFSVNYEGKRRTC
jgi:hypothetical protein